MRIEPPPLELSLKNYGGEELDLAGQIEVQISVPGHAVQTMIQVHREPPVDLLLGTDLQSALSKLVRMMLLLTFSRWTVTKRCDLHYTSRVGEHGRGANNAILHSLPTTSHQNPTTLQEACKVSSAGCEDSSHVTV